MISAFLFALILLLFGLVAAWFGDQVDALRATISCDCGCAVARDALIVDRADLSRVRQALTENCPNCRARRKVGRALPANPQSGEPRTSAHAEAQR